VAGNLNAVHLALRLRAKPALPAARRMENVPFTPPAVDPYSEEDFVPATNRLFSVTVSPGTRLVTGQYVLRWFGVKGDGTDAMNAGIDALLARFATGLELIASDGTQIVIGSASGQNLGAQRGKINTDADTGRPVSTIRIPWWFTATNAL
jgi:hypothetical protein